MAVNLSKNRLALLTAYQDVIDEGSDTNWALYTYEEETNDLTLAASGGGGLAEITLTFDNSLVMYGFCSIKEPSAALPRYILINWVGDDVPDARKCACASHVATIADFFQVENVKKTIFFSSRVEVIVNASSLEDIEPSAIGQRLTNGTTARPGLYCLPPREDPNGLSFGLGVRHQLVSLDLSLVGTVYEKTNAEMEMKNINREEFWEKAKREEELRKEEERLKAAEERRKFEEERMELERLEQENRERRFREREREIEEHRKKLQEDEEAKERQMNQPSVASDPNIEDLSLDKKESEVEEAKAIIAQRSGNPREFFKQKERTMTPSCVDTRVHVHRPGRVDSPFLKQQHSLSTPPPHARTHHLSDETENDVDDDVDEATKRSMSAVSPGSKTCSTATKEDSTDLWDPFPKHESTPPVQDSTLPSKPVQSVAPQPQNSFSVWDSGTDSLVEIWDTKPNQPQSHQAAQSHCPPLVELTGDCSAASEAAGGRPQPLLSFDDVMDGTFCSVNEQEDPPMTLSYQHALQHAANQEPKLDDGQLLMTNGNGDSLLKEGTQASEGYFSQSQEEEFGQSDESSAKATPIFYNKPPEIDITCWDTDPVVDDEDD